MFQVRRRKGLGSQFLTVLKGIFSHSTSQLRVTGEQTAAPVRRALHKGATNVSAALRVGPVAAHVRAARCSAGRYPGVVFQRAGARRSARWGRACRGSACGEGPEARTTCRGGRTVAGQTQSTGPSANDQQQLADFSAAVKVQPVQNTATQERTWKTNL